MLTFSLAPLPRLCPRGRRRAWTSFAENYPHGQRCHTPVRWAGREFAKLPRAFANSKTDVTHWHAVVCVVDEREFAMRGARAEAGWRQGRKSSWIRQRNERFCYSFLLNNRGVNGVKRSLGTPLDSAYSAVLFAVLPSLFLPFPCSLIGFVALRLRVLHTPTDHGLRTTDYGLRTTDHGPRTAPVCSPDSPS